MRPHPYLRAYMAGIVTPSVVLLLAVTAFVIARYGMGVNLPVERALVFPLAFVPSAWGVWNMCYLAWRSRVRMTLGLHGAVLPLLLVPAGVLLARSFDLFEFELPLWTAAAFAPVGVVAYYLVWKYVVGFLNAEVGIA
jgi:hypothetical protein